MRLSYGRETLPNRVGLSACGIAASQKRTLGGAEARAVSGSDPERPGSERVAAVKCREAEGQLVASYSIRSSERSGTQSAFVCVASGPSRQTCVVRAGPLADPVGNTEEQVI